MAFENPIQYKDGKPSSIGSQLIPFHYHRKALIDLKKEMYFGQLADTISMPKHFGKTIVRDYYIPLLDDRNINDQGIDATGVSTANEVTMTIIDPSGNARFAVGSGVDASTASIQAKKKAEDLFKNLGLFDTSLAATITLLKAAGWTVDEGPAVNGGGNMYASSRDVGTIQNKLPPITENGGRKNRVGFTREHFEAYIKNFGFFHEYTEDSVQFDNDPELMSHISRETIRAANEIYEDCLQIDLLNGANVIHYGGDAISASGLTGEKGVKASELTYEALMRVENILNNNRCPKDTTIISGSRMVDTRTIGACRYAYIGSEVKMSLLKMKNFHDKEAFIPVQQYAEAGKVAAGEIGSVGNFRFIENPQMMHWEGAGAEVTDNDGYLEANGKYNVYPVLVVGSNSFSTIGFQSASNNDSKFRIIHKAPGTSAAGREDPYGKTGFYSIQWWYGTMIVRPEWIACIKVVAEQ